MNKISKIFKLCLIVGLIGGTSGLRTMKVNALSSCQEIVKRYEEKDKSEPESTIIAESGDVCGFALLITPRVDETNTKSIEGAQNFYIVKKDGTEIKQQQLAYKEDNSHFPKIDAIFVKGSGDFYAVSYKEYPKGPMEFRSGLGLVAKIDKSTGNIIWQNRATYDRQKEIYSFSKVNDIIEGDVTTLVGNALQGSGEAHDINNVSFPQITMIKGTEVVGKSTYDGYRNFEAVSLEKLTDSRYALKIRNQENEKETKEIIVDEKYEEKKDETRASISKTTDNSKETTNSKGTEKEVKPIEKQEETKTQSGFGLSLPIIVGSALGLITLAGVLYYGMKKKNKK